MYSEPFFLAWLTGNLADSFYFNFFFFTFTYTKQHGLTLETSWDKYILKWKIPFFTVQYNMNGEYWSSHTLIDINNEEDLLLTIIPPST